MDLLETLGIAPPAAENAVCYEIYDEGFVHGASEAQVEALGVRCMQQLLPHLDGYIWQQDPFSLQSSLKRTPPWLLKKRGKQQQQQQQQQQDAVPCLWGVVRYEDNVEDEWFVVWLLLELSRHITTLCVRVWDDDGDFLLIEAAYSLPRWLKPETSTNRVWLRHGQVHIIPPPSMKSPTLPQQPTIRQAITILSSAHVKTHRPRVDRAILSRLSGYPAKALSQRQRVIVWLPRRAALLLHHDPQLIAPAVSAFMTRTRGEVQSAGKMTNLPPDDLTTVKITMNRCQYAQIMQAEFTAPKNYPAIPAPPAAAAGGGGGGGGAAAAAYRDKAAAMGVKILTGLEIMCLRMGLNGSSSSSSSGGSSNMHSQTAADGSDTTSSSSNSQADHQQQQQQQDGDLDVNHLMTNPAWHHYVTVLERSGYFGDQIQGSARYKQLLAAAAAAFRDTSAYLRSSEAMTAPVKHLQQLLTKIDHQQQQQQGPHVGGPAAAAAAVLDAEDLSEDDDCWMEAEAAAVEQQLAAAEAEVAAHEQRRQQRKAAAGQNQVHDQQQQQMNGGGSSRDVTVDAEELVSGFKGFVQHDAAGPEGAEVPRDNRSNTAAAAAAAGGNDHNHHNRDGDSHAGDLPAGVDFNSDAFLNELMGVLGGPGAGSSSSKRRQQQQQDPDALLSTLQSMQQQLKKMLDGDMTHAAAAAAGSSDHGHMMDLDDHDDDSDEDYDTSSSERSSFFGSESSNDKDDDQDHDGDHHEQQLSGHRQPGSLDHKDLSAAEQDFSSQEEFVQLPVPPPVSGSHRRQQEQQRWQLPPSFRGAALQEAWEVLTATDSDDEDNLSLGGTESDSQGGSESDSDSSSKSERPAAAVVQKSERKDQRDRSTEFYEAYDAAMQAELAGTAMAQSFERVNVQDDPVVAAAAADGGGAEELAPLDVDMNLIRSLVASYTAQGGLPGPASNLAGLLGLSLPSEIVEEK